MSGVVTQVLPPIVLLANGMAAGGLIIAVRGAPMILRMPIPQYVPYHQFMVGRFDPFMPACMIIALLGDIGLVIGADSTVARALAGLAALLLLGTVVVSLTRNVPINLWVKTLDPDRLPENFEKLDKRPHWIRWNAVRMGFAVAGLIVNGLALAALL